MDSHAVARMLVMSPNTARPYRQALQAREAVGRALPALDELRRAVERTTWPNPHRRSR